MRYNLYFNKTTLKKEQNNRYPLFICEKDLPLQSVFHGIRF